MTSQDKIDKLEAQNRALVIAMLQLNIGSCNCLTKTPEPSYHSKLCPTRIIGEAISNSPVDLYRKEQEVIEAAIVYINTFSESPEEYDSTVVLEKHITNLQQARQENK